MVKLVKILGHVGITGNVIADREAKEAAKKIVTGQLKTQAKVSIDDARKLSTLYRDGNDVLAVTVG